MKVNGPGAVKPGTVRRGGKSSAGKPGEFARHIAGNEADLPSSGISGATQIGSVEALLAIQGVSDPTHKQHGPAFRRAEDLLEHLEGIRDGILAGVIPRPQLQDLVRRLAEQRPRENDPLVISLLDEIELRAKVELAKLSVI